MTETHVIVGAGIAGVSAALTLRAEGFAGRVVVIEEERHTPYTRPSLSKGIVRGEMTDAKAAIRPEALYDLKNIEMRRGARAAKLDVRNHRVALDDGETLVYDRLLLATGGRPRTLPGAGSIPGVYTFRTMDDAHAVRSRLGAGHSLVIVGGGFIGTELAASARSLGTDVTVLSDGLPMARLLPEPVAAAYSRLHAGHGVRLITGCTVDHIDGKDGEVTVHATDGSAYSAQTVVIAVGLVPDTDLAEAAGIVVDDGIVVDEYCRTSAPDVFAAGDVANHPIALFGERGRIEHWQNSQHQANSAARSMLGNATPFIEVPWVWSDQYNVNLQITGRPDPHDHMIVRGSIEDFDATVFLLRDNRLRSAIGLNRGGEIRAARKLIAAEGLIDPSDLGDESVDLELLAACALEPEPS